MKPHVIKFLQFLEAKEGKNAPLKVKLLNPDKFNITKDELNVKGSLDLSNTTITSLPDGLEIGESLILEGCTSLTSLPDGLDVGWNLDLTGCTSLKSLPNGLEIGGSLDLEGCTSLTSLPNGLYVGTNLYLKNTYFAVMYSEDEIRDMIESKGGYVNGYIEI